MITEIEIALPLIKQFEGFRSAAYLDPVGIPTIGYGSTRYPNGEPVAIGDTVSQAEADEMLRRFIDEELRPKLLRIPTWPKMSAGQRAALMSFGYNLGPGFYGAQGFSTITAALSSSDWQTAVPDALGLYVRAGGRVLQGLVRRRAAEAELWRRSSSTRQPASSGGLGVAIVLGGLALLGLRKV